MDYLDLARAPGADFDVGGRRYGVFARATGAARWLGLMGQRDSAPRFPRRATAPW
jgi:hypothetical protein